MKRVNKLFAMILALLLVVTCMVPVSASDEVTVFLNGEQIVFDVPPMIVNGRTMVPMRAIFEKLGATVEWDDATRTAFATKDWTMIAITVDTAYMEVYDLVFSLEEPQDIMKLDAPAMIVDGRTLIPLRAVSEAFSCDVYWDGNVRRVDIYSDDYTGDKNVAESQEVVYVNTVDELLNEIGSNKKLVLTSGYYNLSEATNWENPYIEAQGYSDGYTIKNITNMTITGNAEIAIDDSYADVLSFRNCGQITLDGLTVGHTVSFEEYQCEGAVTSFYMCDGVTIQNCNLYGCGAVGVSTDYTTNLTVKNCRIYDCSYTGVWFRESDAIVESTKFFDSNYFSGFCRLDNSTAQFNNCEVYNVESLYLGSLIETFDDIEPSSISFKNCTIYDCTFMQLLSDGTRNATFENCVFKDNIGVIDESRAVFDNCVIR